MNIFYRWILQLKYLQKLLVSIFLITQILFLLCLSYRLIKLQKFSYFFSREKCFIFIIASGT